MQKVCLDRGETARCKTAGGADAAKENTHLAAILKPEIYLAFNSLSLSLSLSLFWPLLAGDSIIPLFTITELNVEHFVVKGTLSPFKFLAERGFRGARRRETERERERKGERESDLNKAQLLRIVALAMYNWL